MGDRLRAGIQPPGPTQPDHCFVGGLKEYGMGMVSATARKLHNSRPCYTRRTDLVG